MTLQSNYPFEDFISDFDALDHAGILNEGPLERIMGAASPHFRTKYEADSIRVYRYSRFMISMIYLAEHLQEFDTEDLAVYGSKRVGGLVGEDLLRAVHHTFTSPDTGPPKVDPTPSEILDLARKFRDER